MKRLLLASVAILGTAVSASAADMAAKAPIYKAPPLPSVYDWSGFYMGVNAGIGIGRNRYTDYQPASANSFFLATQGGFGGAQIGYNWQTNSLLGPLVVGIEADIQGSDFSDSARLNTFAISNAYNQKLDWFGTVRGRVGMAKGPVLSYFTAGYAYGNVKTEGAIAGVGAFATSQTRGGWTYGSGVEAAIGGNWTGKIEYLYMHLGDHQDALVARSVLASELRQSVFRVGLNYQINGRNANYVAPSANWTGWYVGVNFGSGTARNKTDLAIGGFVDSYSSQPDGIIGGAQIGYNWQVSNWVWGLETDFQGSSLKDNKTCVLTCTVGQNLQYNSSLPWFGTVRGRLGASIGSTLFYGTGGYAYGSVKERASFTAGGQIGELSQTNTRGGWTVGAGIETPFAFFGLFGPNWTSKTEYLYVDLGKSTATGTLLGAAVTHETSVREHIFRTGLNYKFTAPVGGLF